MTGPLSPLDSLQPSVAAPVGRRREGDCRCAMRGRLSERRFFGLKSKELLADCVRAELSDDDTKRVTIETNTIQRPPDGKVQMRWSHLFFASRAHLLCCPSVATIMQDSAINVGNRRWKKRFNLVIGRYYRYTVGRCCMLHRCRAAVPF
jgi:hypothetical protein